MCIFGAERQTVFDIEKDIVGVVSDMIYDHANNNESDLKSYVDELAFCSASERIPVLRERTEKTCLAK